MKKKVMIVGKNQETCNSYKIVIDGTNTFCVVGKYEFGEDAVREIPKIFPDIILMSIDLAGKSGIEITEIIKKKYPHVEVLIISPYIDSGVVFASLKAGAGGYVTQGSTYLQLISSLEQISRGGAPMSDEISRMIIREFQTNLNSPITKREKQVLQMVSAGMTYTQISEELNISKETSKTHIRNIYTKLNVSCKAEAVSRGREDKLII
ncbi:MAG TPA: response regulator transcription factor [Cyclobacteriaceae bacterium]|nr:response regulator transcription factor [Cyclobacteriaceae bacterium]HMV10231.1 response regulator transcription factor [Cyclobacteriaceae bacterium]HMV89765.1 response regulator transcription factor [Cyclobacteriaceae bacterium]HMX01568.1 response regulator transcription factor [Cyclobacteriaceae bacterium]HMX51431.1 response regulator transcription factor [Cyclobacteriaceae bacterium]